MADELRDSPFLGERTIKFVSSILSTSRYQGIPASVVTPVTGFEKKLLENQEKICEMNEALDGELLELLRNAKDYIPPHTAMRVLLYGNKKGFLQQAQEIVYYSAEYRLVLTDEEINEIVSEIRKDSSTPVQWMMNLYGDDKSYEDDEPKVKNKLNLPKDFA